MCGLLRRLPVRLRLKNPLFLFLLLLLGLLAVVVPVFRLLASNPSVQLVRPRADLHRPHKTSCQFYSCFSINECEIGPRHDRVGVHVYPETSFVDGSSRVRTPQMSAQFQEIVDAIRGSPYHQPNVSRACVFVVAVDTLNQNKMDVDIVSAILHSVPRWREGQNHLIFNMLPGSHPDYNTIPDFYYGKAMLAGAGFTQDSYRMGFDVAIPVFNPLTWEAHYPTTAGQRHQRALLTVLSRGWNNDKLTNQLSALVEQHYDDVVVLEGCPPHRVDREVWPQKRCMLGGDVVAYPQVLETSFFCALLPGARYGSSSFTDFMMTGCIPVLLGDTHVLPFSETIDWSRASVSLWSLPLEDVIHKLREIPPRVVLEMRDQVLFLYRSYFVSMAAITMTTLDIINQRVFPLAVRSYEQWNNAPYDPAATNRFQHSFPRGFPLPAPPPSEGFTAVILTYNRVPMLFDVIRSVAKATSLAKIVVVWNNLEKDPPPVDVWPRINKPIQIIRSKHNRLSNRFYPHPEIETAAVLSLDDDITMLTADELDFGYKAWLEFPDHLVGFPGRIHAFDEATEAWKYVSSWENNISLILTGASFYHKFYHYLYTFMVPRQVRDWVDSHMNCEDIAMNFIIANFTRKPPLKVSPRKKFRCPSCGLEGSLWSDPEHYLERNKCMNAFAKFFNGVPLQTTKLRLDPVLYKDAIDDRYKSFPHMGEL